MTRSSKIAYMWVILF